MLEWLYVACLLLLAVYGVNSFLLTLIYWLKPRAENPTPANRPSSFTWPIVTVQLPIFNERYVVERLLNAVCCLDYPRERLQIQVLDDSTDETREMIDQLAERLSAQGVWIEVRRRPTRAGFKAGALAEALRTARGELIAIFDADFLPKRDFLKRTLPEFRAPRVGCVQARWDHVNREYSLLTQLQAAGIDGHFMIEQEARNRVGWFIGFNGSAGVWRKACIVAAGGWQGDTLTEDLDLSYRAQFAGWQFRFLSEVTVPAEIPAQMDAYKRQQFRWAKGSLQTAKKLLPSLWRSRLSLATKLQGTLHLTGYLMHPLMVIAFLLAVPMSLAHSPVFGILPYFVIAMIGPFALYGSAIARRSRPSLEMIGTLIMLVILGTGISINNSRAAVEALLGINSSFRRTPKFALRSRMDQWCVNRYALPRDPIVWLEITASVGALAFFVYANLHHAIRSNEWLLIYALGYGYVAGLSLWQSLGRALTQRAR